MRTLFVLNDQPYGSERVYNGLRLATSLATREHEVVWVFLMGDATWCAKAGQEVPKGWYNIEALLKLLLGHGGRVGACGTCLQARGVSNEELLEGVEPASLQELTDWIQEADRTLVF